MPFYDILHAIEGLLAQRSAPAAITEAASSASVAVFTKPELVSEIFSYMEPLDDSERWEWVSTMATVSTTFQNVILLRHAPTTLTVTIAKEQSEEERTFMQRPFMPTSRTVRKAAKSPSNKLTNKGELHLTVSHHDDSSPFTQNFLNLDDLVGVPRLLYKVKDITIASNSRLIIPVNVASEMPRIECTFLTFDRRAIDSRSRVELDDESSLRCVDLDWKGHLSNEALNAFLQTSGQNLLSLKLHNIRINDDKLHIIGQNCHQLKSFMVEGSNFISANGISAVSGVNPGINKLHLVGCDNIDGNQLMPTLARDSPKLQHLILCEIYNLSAENLTELLEILGPNLKTLRLHKCTPAVGPFARMSDRELNVIAKYCHRLESFAVTEPWPDGHGITPTGISSVLRENPGIVELDLTNCLSEIYGYEIVSLVTQDYPQVRTLDNTLIDIARALPELHTITFSYNDGTAFFHSISVDGVRRTLEESSALGRGIGKIVLWSPIYTTGHPRHTRPEWKMLPQEFPDVNFVFKTV